MSKITVEPLIHGGLLSTKLLINIEDSEGNINKDNVLKILINCGWSLDFDEEQLNLYKRFVTLYLFMKYRKIEDIDVFLITDGDFSHSGALLWLISKLLSETPRKEYPMILCTEGTYKFVRASLIDVLENVTFTGNFEYYSVEDLDLFNNKCVKLRYRETYCFFKKFGNREVKASFSALNNGYSVGGAIWYISIGFSTIVCGDKIRIYPSTLLNGTKMDDFYKPDLLLLSHEEFSEFKHVTDPKGVEVCPDLDSLVDKLVGTLMNGGNVLFPMDVDYSLLNLLIHLNMIWSTSHLSQFKIVLASPIADKLLLLIGTCLEYVKSSIFHNFIKTLWNPLMDLSHIDIITSLNQLSKYRYRPTVFISTPSSVDFGFSNFLFLAISSYYKNLVVLTKPNTSVTKFVPGTGDSQLPQYKLQINLNYNKGRQDGVEIVEPERRPDHRDSSYFQKFGGVGGQGPFAPSQAGGGQADEAEERNAQDYGLPFTEFLADPSNPYGHPVFQSFEEQFEQEIEYVHEQDEHTQLDDYYRKYIDSSKDKLFEIEGESSQDQQPKTDLLTKKFQFFMKSQVCLVNCLSNLSSEQQMTSVLHHTSPRNVVLVPDSENYWNKELYLSKLLKCKFHSFNLEEVKVKTGSELNKVGRNKEVVTLSLNLSNYPVLLNEQLLVNVRNFFNRRLPLEYVKIGNMSVQGIETVMNGVRMWKHKNNNEKVCQIISKVKLLEELKNQENKNEIIQCKTFWSEESGRKSNLEMIIECNEGNEYKIKKGIKSTLLIGDVSMSTYVKFIDECLPNSIKMISGNIFINEKVSVSKKVYSNNKEWVIEGTLDPSYYLSRKLLKKLHSSIEPIY